MASPRSQIKAQMMQVAQADPGGDAAEAQSWQQQSAQPIDVYGTQAARDKLAKEGVKTTTGIPAIDRALTRGEKAGRVQGAIQARQSVGKHPQPAMPRLSNDELSDALVERLKTAPVLNSRTEPVQDADVAAMAEMTLRRSKAGAGLSDEDVNAISQNATKKYNDYVKMGYSSKPLTPEEAQNRQLKLEKRQVNLKKRALGSAKKDMEGAMEQLGLKTHRTHKGKKDPSFYADWHNLKGRQLQYAQVLSQKWDELRKSGLTDQDQLDQNMQALRPYAKALGLGKGKTGEKKLRHIEDLVEGRYNPNAPRSHHKAEAADKREARIRGQLAAQGLDRAQIDEMMNYAKTVQGQYAEGPRPRHSRSEVVRPIGQ